MEKDVKHIGQSVGIGEIAQEAKRGRFFVQ